MAEKETAKAPLAKGMRKEVERAFEQRRELWASSGHYQPGLYDNQALMFAASGQNSPGITLSNAANPSTYTNAADVLANQKR